MANKPISKPYQWEQVKAKTQVLEVKKSHGAGLYLGFLRILSCLVRMAPEEFTICFCKVFPVLVPSCGQCVSMLLNLGELVHNLSYWLSDTLLQCTVCFLANCFHFAFPRTGRKNCFQVQKKMENEDWSYIEEMAKGEKDWKGLSRNGTTHSCSGCITLVEIKNNVSI